MKDKENKIEIADKIIGDLVYSKKDLIKAYNYYNGVRNDAQFKYLEENYGLGTPTSVQFTPLVRKHIDAIIGEYLETEIVPHVTCIDTETIDAIEKEKNEHVTDRVKSFLTERMNNKIRTGNHDAFIEDKLNKLINESEIEYVSNYEIGSQNIINYIIQSNDIDIINKRRIILLDLLNTGYGLFTVKPSENDENLNIEVLNPLNTYFDLNPNSQYLRDSYRCVIRRWMNKYEILMKYGKYLSEDDKEILRDKCDDSVRGNNTFYVRSYEGVPGVNGLVSSEITPSLDNSEDAHYIKDLWCVDEVEWINIDKDDIQHRDTVIKIGNEIHIVLDQDINVVRSKANPKKCGLSLGGVYFANRSNRPYSLMLACADLQDKYDILLFYRDTIVASSGTVGDWLDIPTLPQELGVNFTERLQKYIAYKKQGIGLINTSQEGISFNNNTTLSGYDDTLKVQAMQAIEIAIERVENTCSSITGVFRERLNGIQQRDAVSNIKVGVQNSFIVTKQITHQMDLITVEILNDCLNLGKKVYKNGLTGALILGEKNQKIFRVLPEHFINSDHNIHIISGSTILRDVERIKEVTNQFAASGIVDPEIILEAMTAKSMTELKQKVKAAIKKKKEENDILTKLQQQVSTYEEQMKEAEQQIKSLSSKLEEMDQAKLQLEQEKLKLNDKLDWFKVNYMKEQGDKRLALEEKKIDIEYAQMYDGNQHNNPVNFNK